MVIRLLRSELFWIKVLGHLDLIGDDCLASWLPIGWADDSVLVRVLECLDKPVSLVHTSANLLVVDSNGSDDPFSVNDHESSEGGSIKRVFGVVNEDSVLSWDLLCDVWDQRNRDFSKSSILSCSLSPGQMRKVGINWDSQNLSVDSCEVGGLGRVTDDLSGADVSEVEGIEEKDNVLASIVFEAHGLETQVWHNGMGCEVEGPVPGHDRRGRKDQDWNYKNGS